MHIQVSLSLIHCEDLIVALQLNKPELNFISGNSSKLNVLGVIPADS